ncbi:hypothetical protein H4217_006863 [Coemansia sp. RSA 1939]|nr:hypothetical protein H4217_006863 [Coemansia sp. RSA 1939]
MYRIFLLVIFFISLFSGASAFEIRLRPAVGVVAAGGVAAAVAHEGYIYWTQPKHEYQPYRLVCRTLSPDFFKRRGPPTDLIIVPGQTDMTNEDGRCALGQGTPLCLVVALLSLRRKRSGTIANYDAGIDRNDSCNGSCENKCNGRNSNFVISDNNCSGNSTMNNDRTSNDYQNTDSNSFNINTGRNDSSISDGSKHASQDIGNSNDNDSGCKGAGCKYIDSNSNNYSNYINNMATVFADTAVPVKQVPAFATLADSVSRPNNGLDSHRPLTLPFLPCDGSRVCANKANIKRCEDMFSFSCFDEKQLELGLPFMDQDLDNYEIVSIESIDSEDYDMVYAENENSMRAIDSLKFKAKEVRRKASMAFRGPVDARLSAVPGMYQDSMAAGSQTSLLGGKGKRKALAKKVSRIFSKR